MSSSSTTQEYNCTPCGFFTTTKSRYTQHLKTKKHARLHPENVENTNNTNTENKTISMTIKDLGMILNEVYSTCQINTVSHVIRNIMKPLLQDVKIFTIPIHVEKDNEVFDTTLKAICVTNVLSEEEIHMIHSLANVLAQSYSISALNDPKQFEEFKSELKNVVMDEKNIDERITFCI